MNWVNRNGRFLSSHPNIPLSQIWNIRAKFDCIIPSNTQWRNLKKMFPEKVLQSSYLQHILSKMVIAIWLFLVGPYSKKTIYTNVSPWPGVYASCFLEYQLHELGLVTLLQGNNSKHLSQTNSFTWLIPCKQKNPFLLAAELAGFIRVSTQTPEYSGNMQLWMVIFWNK